MLPGPKRYASPTSRSAAVAFAVNTHRYSSGDAPKKSSTARRALCTSSVVASDVGLFECGLPRTRVLSRSACAATWLRACSPPPV